MEKDYFADIIINKEELSNGNEIFVANCTNLGIASQGDTTEEAVKNIKEAIELYLEEQPESYNELRIAKNPPFFSFLGIKKQIKNA